MLPWQAQWHDLPLSSIRDWSRGKLLWQHAPYGDAGSATSSDKRILLTRESSCRTANPFGMLCCAMMSRILWSTTATWSCGGQWERRPGLHLQS